MTKARKADRSSKAVIKKRKKIERPRRKKSVAKMEKKYAPRDLEDIYIGDLLSKKESTGGVEAFPHHIIYNSTDEMRRFSYRYGFSVGKEIYRRTEGADSDALLKVLECAGIGKILYTPFDDGAVIRGSGARVKHGARCLPMHSYESGIISGYLSAHSSRPVFTKETHCIYAGDGFCQFAAHEWESGIDETRPKLFETIDAVSSSLRHIEGRKSGAYLLLSLVPVIKEPMLGESEKLMFLFGKRLAADRSPEEGIQEICKMFGMGRVAVARRDSGISVSIRYNGYNSTSGFLGLSTKAFIGFLSKSFNSQVRLRESRQKSHYAATLSVTQGAN